MKLGRLFGVGLLARAIARELRGIKTELQTQNALLERLAVRYAPAAQPIEGSPQARDTGVDFLDPHELALAMDYAQRTEHDTGVRPSDEQLIAYLADERTVDLHQRLSEREQEMQRLQREKRS
jgi:hypothetical protein